MSSTVTANCYQVELENATTKKRYVFRCGRWLAKNEDDGSLVREMPAEGDDINKPQLGERRTIIYIFLSLYSAFSTFLNFFLFFNVERFFGGDSLR